MYLQEFVFLLHASQLDTEVRYFVDSTIISKLLEAKQKIMLLDSGTSVVNSY